MESHLSKALQEKCGVSAKKAPRVSLFNVVCDKELQLWLLDLGTLGNISVRRKKM